MDNLIFQIQQDNKYAFKQLYQNYYSRVVAFIAGIIKKQETAQDLAQDVLSISGLTGRRWMFHEICRTIFLLLRVMQLLII